MSKPPPNGFNPLAGLAALILPGAGHLVLGRPRRAVLAAVGVLGLFFFGLLIGGIDAVDREDDAIWFYGQALVGAPVLIVDAIHQSRFKAKDPVTGRSRSGMPNERRAHDGTDHVWTPLTAAEIEQGMGPPNTPGLGRINEIAMLSIVLAGMLNLIVFLDALMPGPEKTPRAKSSAPSVPSAAPPAGPVEGGNA